MKKFIVIALMLFSSISVALSENMILKAMRDEINRSMDELYIEGLSRPYYIEYTLVQRSPHQIQSQLGKITDSKITNSAVLTVSVRVGDYKFDNSNYFDFGFNFFGSGDDEEQFKNRRIPVEIDYHLLRRELWLATDAAYKQSSEVFSKKESSLKNRVRRDTTHDFLQVPPRVTFDTDSRISLDMNKFENIANELSAIFRKYSDIQVSLTAMEFQPDVTYYVNSEGMEFIRNDYFTGIEVVASAQAEDGMVISDYRSFYAINPDDLPKLDSMKSATENMAKILSEISRKETLEEPYSGPVLFTEQAAAEVIAQAFAPNLVAQRRPMMDGGFFTDDERFAAFQNRVGGRVLPEFLSLEAKPSLSKFANTRLVGHFSLDDDGLPAKDVLLVENGYLRNLLSSRVPTRRIRESNGHNRGGAPMISNIIFSANDNQLSDSELKEHLLKLIKDRELPYGIIVRRVQNQNVLSTTLFGMTYGTIDFPRGQQRILINEAYKVYPDGKEELIRGSNISGLTAQSFRDILKVGKDKYVMNYLAPSVASSFVTGGSAYLPSSISAFSLLFEDVDVRAHEGDFAKPPFIARPVVKK